MSPGSGAIDSTSVGLVLLVSERLAIGLEAVTIRVQSSTLPMLPAKGAFSSPELVLALNNRARCSEVAALEPRTRPL